MGAEATERFDGEVGCSLCPASLARNECKVLRQSGTGTKLAEFRSDMQNEQLHQLMQSLIWKVVFVIFFGSLAGLLLRELLQWIDRRVTRFARGVRESRAVRKTTSSSVTARCNAGERPHCPSCNRAMVKRTARRDALTGSEFWGCSSYPTCRGTRSI